MCNIIVKIKTDDGIKMPALATEGASGFDLRSSEKVTVESHSTTMVNTGLKLEIEIGYEAQIRGRSGLALKGITVANSPGTIDSDYRGHIKAILHNSTDEDFNIEVGDRIAQLVIAKVPKVKFIEVNELSETDRGDRGFGSTGIK